MKPVSLRSLLLLTTLAVPMWAQEPAPLAGARALFGEVIHDETGAPLAGASVVLATQGEGIVAGDVGASSLVMQSRSTMTDAEGRYRFDGVAAGAYTLRIHRLGFRPASVDVVLRSGDSRISVGLAVIPVRLHPVSVERETDQPFVAPRIDSGSVDDREGAARVAAILQRQRLYLSTDVREVTRSDLVEGVTLGETDLFRAIQRMPAVTSRDERSAELWTRNARWDRTRVLFDGMPLFNPLHSVGAISAVNEDAVGAAFLHTGVRPAALGEGSAGLLDIRSRAGGGTSRLRGAYDVTLLSERLTLDQRVAAGRGAWLIALRLATDPPISPSTRSRSGDFSKFSELTARTDWALGAGYSLAVSGLHEQDDASTGVYTQQIPRARWGNDIVRVSLASDSGAVSVRHSVGLSRYGAHVDRLESLLDPSAAIDFPISAGLTYVTLGTEIAASSLHGAVAPWSAGWELVHQRADMVGATRAIYLGDPFDETETSRRNAVTNLGLWGERRIHASGGVTVVPGVRLEVGNAVRGAGMIRVSPRFVARFVPEDSSVLYSAAIGRSYQYLQSLDAFTPVSPAKPGYVPLWLMAGGDVPALRTDLATVGAERWLGERWHGSLNAYARRTVGLVVPDPRAGPITAHELFVEGSERARGAEASLRRVQGRWTTALGYQIGSATISAAGESFAPTQDRRQAFDMTVLSRVWGGWRVGAAYTAATGTPYTRVQAGVEAFDTVTKTSSWQRVPATEAPNAWRLPNYEGLDLLFDWTGKGPWKTRIALSLQLHDIYKSGNYSGYTGSSPCTVTGSPSACVQSDWLAFGLEPSIYGGIRIAF